MKLTIILLLLPLILHGQYEPEIDASGDPGQLQLSTPSLDHFVRLASGRDGDPNPYLYFANSDTFRIATGDVAFGAILELLKIEPDGSMTIKSLQGIGDSGVAVDSEGKLKRTDVSAKYISIPASAFQPDTVYSATQWISSRTKSYFNGTANNALVCPLILPHGVQVTEVVFEYLDNDPTYDINFKIWEMSGNSGTALIHLSPSAASTLPQSETSTTPFTIDAINNSYTIELTANAPFQMNTTKQIYRVRIRYFE
ncbi:MAG: hypothetical protein KDC80_02490 [Saprospiraceae bacterium]|nr:hypothetical protein [Saprospiraceae bacterium]